MGDQSVDLEQFDIVIRRSGRQYSAGIPALGLFVSAADRPSALAALDDKRTRFEGELAAADMRDLVAAPRRDDYADPRTARSPVGEIGRFSLKAIIVAALFAVVIVVSGTLLASQFDEGLKNARELTKIGGAPFWSKLEQELARAADPKTDLAAAKKQQLLANLRVIVQRWRPFVAEIAPLFSNDQIQNGQPKTTTP
jgi:hypothetical protein